MHRQNTNKNYSHKQFSKKFITLVLSLLLFIWLFNFMMDPIGVYRDDCKFQHTENKAYPEYVALKIYSDYNYGIRGTTRSQKINQIYLNKYNFKDKNLSLPGRSIDLNQPSFKDGEYFS